MKAVNTKRWRLNTDNRTQRLCFTNVNCCFINQCRHSSQTKAKPIASTITQTDNKNTQQSRKSKIQWHKISFGSQSKSIINDQNLESNSNDFNYSSDYSSNHTTTLASSISNNIATDDNFDNNDNRNAILAQPPASTTNTVETPQTTLNAASTAQTTRTKAREGAIRGNIKSLRQLSKWNLSCLNGFVTASSAFACSGGLLSVTVPATIGCISLATSASALNQLQEYKFDSLMSRTKLKRPLCNGKLSKQQASLFIVTSLATGSYVLYTYCGTAATLIGVTTMLAYNFLYTPLKRHTPYNTEFGAIVGALPPQIGIAATKYIENINNGNENITCLELLNEMIYDPLCLFTFALLYAWQMPHFLYLSIRNKSDYIKGGFKMWSHNQFDESPNNTLCKQKSLNWSIVLLPLPAMLAYSGATSMMFAFDGTLVTTLYFASVLKWYNEDNSKNGNNNNSGNNSKYGRKSFFCNLIYLPTILFLMLIHSKRWKYERGEFIGTHLAWLQDRGIEWCWWLDESDKKSKYESSKLPETQIACSSPFRTEIHAEPQRPEWIIKDSAEIVDIDK